MQGGLVVGRGRTGNGLVSPSKSRSVHPVFLRTDTYEDCTTHANGAAMLQDNFERNILEEAKHGLRSDEGSFGGPR